MIDPSVGTDEVLGCGDNQLLPRLGSPVLLASQQDARRDVLVIKFGCRYQEAAAVSPAVDERRSENALTETAC